MKRKQLRIIAVLLIFTLMLGLTSCGDTTGTNASGNDVETAAAAAELKAAVEEVKTAAEEAKVAIDEAKSAAMDMKAAAEEAAAAKEAGLSDEVQAAAEDNAPELPLEITDTPFTGDQAITEEGEIPEAGETSEGESAEEFAFSGGSGPDQLVMDPGMQQLYQTAAGSTAASGYKLVNYQYGDVFTITVPNGWKFDLVGYYACFGFRMWDPNDPDVQFFYYGELGPYYASQAGKDQMISAYGSGNYFAVFPVLNPPTVLNTLQTMNAYSDQFEIVNGFRHSFPVISNMKNTVNNQNKATSYSALLDEAVITSDLTSTTGKACKGAFQGDVLRYETYYGDMIPNIEPCLLYGIIAPEEKFEELAPLLLYCLCSFKFTDKYISDGLALSEFQAASAKAYSDAWNAQMEAMVNNFLAYIRS